MDISVKLTRQENADYYGVSVNDIVQVPFDKYVAAVVASEIGNSPLEACKAQAVAARTFAVCKGVLEGKVITDSSSTDQAYRVKRYDQYLYPTAIMAEAHTSGEILTYNGKAISAVYSACNGGKTTSAKERWGSDRVYLPAQEDPWDDSTKKTGHGVGMSQRGAKAMANAGKTYTDILAFYYPGTVIETIGDDAMTPQPSGGKHMVNASDFVAKVMIPLNEGWGYIYGQWGAIWTQDKQNAATREQTRKYGQQWVGKMVTDCSGLVRWALKQLGADIPHHATYQYTDWCSPKGKLVNGQRDDGMPIQPGTLVFIQGNQAKIHHVGVYVGNDICVEAKGTNYGVVTSQLSHWDHWGECKLVDYSNSQTMEVNDIMPLNAKQAVTVNPNTYLNMRSGPSSSYPVVTKIAKGSTVEIINDERNDYWQIKYGGRIGWAMAKYLMPVVDTSTVDDIPSVSEPATEYSGVVPNITDIQTTISLMRATVNGLLQEIDNLERAVQSFHVDAC